MTNRTFPSHHNAGRSTAGRWARAANTLRGALVLRREPAARLPPSATLNIQVWLQAVPWRPTAGWSVVAGLLAAGAFSAAALDWPRLILAWLLADLLWGSLWRMAGGRAQLLPLGREMGEARLRLPYLQPGSPAAELLNLDTANSMPYVVRIAAPTLGLALLVALALGRAALIGTALMAAVTVLGWILRRSPGIPTPLLHALAVVALPWWLTLTLFGAGATRMAGLAGALLLLWTLHHWGETRCALFPDDWVAPALLGAAELGIAGLLIYAKAPIWLAVLAVLALPTWIAVYRRQSLGGQRAWWLAAMLISAAAVGQLG